MTSAAGLCEGPSAGRIQSACRLSERRLMCTALALLPAFTSIARALLLLPPPSLPLALS